MLPADQMHPAAGCKAAAPTTTGGAASSTTTTTSVRHIVREAFGDRPVGGSREVAAAAAVVDVCLAAAAMAGAALLAWWALAFHPTYARLWMVPVGLVLACTPAVVCAALRLSPAPGGGVAAKGAAAGASTPLYAVVVDK
ncbi:hypothetical protein ACP70R_002818 [Stipagrostis hirtigluma subsp. patula]